MATEIVLTKKSDLKGYTLIEGFPGIGLIGTIAAHYLVEKKKMVQIGYVYSSRFPPLTNIHEGKPSFPMQIYADPKNKLCVLTAEFIVPANVVYELADQILEFAKKNKIARIVSLAGMTAVTEEEMGKVYGISSDDKTSKELTKKGIKVIQEGITTGVSGVLMARCAANNFPAISLLSQSAQRYPDPRAAVTLLEGFAKATGVAIDTTDLMKEAGEIEKKMQRVVTQMQKGAKGVKPEESYQSMFG